MDLAKASNQNNNKYTSIIGSYDVDLINQLAKKSIVFKRSSMPGDIKLHEELIEDKIVSNAEAPNKSNKSTKKQLNADVDNNSVKELFENSDVITLNQLIKNYVSQNTPINKDLQQPSIRSMNNIETKKESNTDLDNNSEKELSTNSGVMTAIDTPILIDSKQNNEKSMINIDSHINEEVPKSSCTILDLHKELIFMASPKVTIFNEPEKNKITMEFCTKVDIGNKMIIISLMDSDEVIATNKDLLPSNTKSMNNKESNKLKDDTESSNSKLDSNIDGISESVLNIEEFSKPKKRKHKKKIPSNTDIDNNSERESTINSTVVTAGISPILQVSQQKDEKIIININSYINEEVLKSSNTILDLHKDDILKPSPKIEIFNELEENPILKNNTKCKPSMYIDLAPINNDLHQSNIKLMSKIESYENRDGTESTNSMLDSNIDGISKFVLNIEESNKPKKKKKKTKKKKNYNTDVENNSEKELTTDSGIVTARNSPILNNLKQKERKSLSSINSYINKEMSKSLNSTLKLHTGGISNPLPNKENKSDPLTSNALIINSMNEYFESLLMMEISKAENDFFKNEEKDTSFILIPGMNRFSETLSKIDFSDKPIKSTNEPEEYKHVSPVPSKDALLNEFTHLDFDYNESEETSTNNYSENDSDCDFSLALGLFDDLKGKPEVVNIETKLVNSIDPVLQRRKFKKNNKKIKGTNNNIENFDEWLYEKYNMSTSEYISIMDNSRSATQKLFDALTIHDRF